MAELPAELGRLPVAVRGLCRHAIDGAVRGLALRWAVVDKHDLRDTLITLDRHSRTKERLRHARRYGTPGRPSPASDAKSACSAYLDVWNRAAHDTGGDSMANLRDEVEAAREACRLLAAWGGE
jgi:hypothetical protein